MNNADRIAIALREAAAAYEQHGELVRQRADEWHGAGSGGGSGPRQKGTHSDPTGMAALKSDGPQAALKGRLAAVADDARVFVALVGGHYFPPPVPLANSLRAMALVVTRRRATLKQLNKAYALACEVQELIRCAVEVEDVAPPKTCEACDSPADKLVNGWCEADRKLAARHPEHAGDRMEFRAYVIRRVVDPADDLDRPLSPHSLTEVSCS